MSAGSTISRLGRYQLSRVLGQGAMGVVYEGLDPVLNRQVAVKTILRSALVDADTLADSSARFVREAQAIARLSHPHIVTVFDFGEEGDVAYFVMEFVRGRELKSYFDGGEFFDIDESLRIVGELLAALDFAHQQGVVHRDVKPANVMLDAGRRVKLTDFGVARLADSGSDRTMAGTMVGTPSYMSPEQIQGLAVGSRTDLFAAGIILYQCLTHTKPFPGPGAWAVQKQIVHDDPVPPSVVDPAIDPRFDAIIARALAKDPADRYASAAEFAADLRRVLALAGGDDGVAATAPLKPPLAEIEPGRPSPAPAGSEDTLVEPAAGVSAGPFPEPTLVSPLSPQGAKTAGRPVSWLVGGGALVILAVLAVILALPARQPSPASPVPVAPSATVESAAKALPPAPEPVVPAASATAPTGQAEVAVPGAPPAPAAKAEALAPVAKPDKPVALAARPARTEVAPKARPVAGKASSNPRCDDLLQRFQLGEGLSPEDLMVLQKECRK